MGSVLGFYCVVSVFLVNVSDINPLTAND